MSGTCYTAGVAEIGYNTHEEAAKERHHATGKHNLVGRLWKFSRPVQSQEHTTNEYQNEGQKANNAQLVRRLPTPEVVPSRLRSARVRIGDFDSHIFTHCLSSSRLSVCFLAIHQNRSFELLATCTCLLSAERRCSPEAMFTFFLSPEIQYNATAVWSIDP